MERGVTVTQNLVSIAMTVVNDKSAAIHYETMVAAHAFTGSDVGELGHSRKQFNEILRCADVWCNREIAKFLRKPLASTRLPPHFYVTCDKATPNRLTNQAVMVCPVVNGKREAIAVSSSEVYHEADNGVEGDVNGSTAAEWARMVYGEIKKAYPAIEDKIIQGSWAGTVCDGVYQASDFNTTLKSLLIPKELDQSIFFSVLWDSAHFLDLAFSDVFEGKIGKSNAFVNRLVERTCVLHKIFQRGKLLKHAIEMLKTDDDLVLRLTSRTCSTRFTASQYVEFKKLLKSLPLHIKTFREFNFSEVKDYMIAGKDLVLDLCGICDALAPLIELMVEIQSLNLPCSKVVTWWPCVKKHLELMKKNLSLQTPSTLLPEFKKHVAEIEAGSFKG